MCSQEQMHALIRGVYAAAADERRWPATLEKLADTFRGGVAGLQYRTGIEGDVRSAHFARFDPVLADAYRTYFATRNPWIRLSQPLYQTGLVYSPEQYLPVADLRRTEFYDGILRPQGLVHCFGACVYRRGNDVLSFTVVRSPSAGSFADAELKRVSAILPHIHRAVQTNERLATLRRTQTALTSGFEYLRHGVVLLNARGQVTFANRTARAIVQQGDGLSITADGLVASVFAERLHLRSLIDDAVNTSAGRGFGAGGGMRISRPSMKRPFLVLVTPLGMALEGERSGMATAFISDPETQAETIEELTRRRYGLTATEARVATAFAATASLDQIREQLGISRETVRWHLRRLYRKTGTSRQAALLLRLSETSSRLTLPISPTRDV